MTARDEPTLASAISRESATASAEMTSLRARLAEAEELLRDCRDLNTTGLRRRIERFLDREENDEAGGER